MRDLYKNPILYYIAVPVIVGLWPFMVWAVWLPAAQEDVEQQMADYERAEPIMMDILTLDPGRLEFADANDTAPEFTWSAVDNVANRCKIPENKCQLHSGRIIKTGGRENQSANVSLTQVGITEFAEFLSLIQLRWVNLQCERAKLTKRQNLPDNDMWDIDVTFKYYY